MASYQVLNGVLSIRLIFLSRKNLRSVAYLPALILLPTIYFQVNKKAINVWPTANKHASLRLLFPLCGMCGYTRITNSLQVYYIIIF